MQGKAKVSPFLVMPTIKGATWHKNRQFFYKKTHDTHLGTHRVSQEKNDTRQFGKWNAP
jgi:hypothetical protein